MNLVTTDQIFNSWHAFREQIIEDANNACKLYRSDVCMSNSLTSTNFFTQRECCSGCNTLKTLMTSFFLNEQREISVASGVKKGTLLKVFSRDNVDTTVMDDGISHNPFMNYVIVSCIMKKILQIKSYPVNIPFEWAYICKDKFNIILDVTNISSIKDISTLKHLTNTSPLARKTIYNPISKDIIATIFKQTALLCHFYSKYKFSHGEPSITYISLNPLTTRFTYSNIHVDSPIKVSVSPSMYSSIVYRNTRFALRKNTDKYIKTYENRDVNIIGSKYSGDYKNHRVIYIKIGNKSEQFLKNLSNGYCEIRSFDFVMFISSLMVNRQFMTSFKDCPYVDIWKNIWRACDYHDLSVALSAIKTNSFKNVFDVVKQYYFRVDSLEYALSNF